MMQIASTPPAATPASSLDPIDFSGFMHMPELEEALKNLVEAPPPPPAPPAEAAPPTETAPAEAAPSPAPVEAPAAEEAKPKRSISATSNNSVGSASGPTSDVSARVSGISVGFPVGEDGTITLKLEQRQNTGTSDITGASVNNNVVGASVEGSMPLNDEGLSGSIALGGEISSANGTRSNIVMIRPGVTQKGTVFDDKTAYSVGASLGLAKADGAGDADPTTLRPRVNATISRPVIDDVSVTVSALIEERMSLNDAARTAATANGNTIVSLEAGLTYKPEFLGGGSASLSYFNTPIGLENSNDPLGGPGGRPTQEGASGIKFSLNMPIKF
jgi:hypothetical protein